MPPSEGTGPRLFPSSKRHPGRIESSWRKDTGTAAAFSRSGTIATGGRDSATLRRRMHAIDGKEIWEVPMSTWCFGSFNIPFGGGGYLRLYPWSLTKALFRKVTENGKPVVVYVHPWEFDHKHPMIDAPFLKRIRHHTGISGMKKKIRFLLQYFQFGTVEQHLEDMIGSKSTRP